MVDLIGREGTAALAVQFAIRTACRSGEVRGAKWCEIDLNEKLWAIPAQRRKAGKEHRGAVVAGLDRGAATTYRATAIRSSRVEGRTQCCRI